MTRLVASGGEAHKKIGVASHRKRSLHTARQRKSDDGEIVLAEETAVFVGATVPRPLTLHDLGFGACATTLSLPRTDQLSRYTSHTEHYDDRTKNDRYP
jgi:hypothetical protein